MNGDRHPGDCLCSECTADSIYEFWLDEEYIEARRELDQPDGQPTTEPR